MESLNEGDVKQMSEFKLDKKGRTKEADTGQAKMESNNLMERKGEE